MELLSYSSYPTFSTVPSPSTYSCISSPSPFVRNSTNISNCKEQLRKLQGKVEVLETEVSELRKINQELHQTNEELRKVAEAAEAASRSKTAFLATMSHEVRTPLTAIVGFAELLLDSELETKEKEEARIIFQNGKELTRLLNDILDLSKVESGRMEIEKVRFSVKDLATDVCKLLSHSANEKGLKLTIKLKCEDPLEVISDPTRLRQILLNLLGNAIKFTDQGSVTLSLSCSSDPFSFKRTLKCAIQDTGTGICPNAASKLFQPFVQADSSTSRKHGGTGLGLFLSRQLAQLLGGNLVLEYSHPGLGSCFALSVDAGLLEESPISPPLAPDSCFKYSLSPPTSLEGCSEDYSFVSYCDSDYASDSDSSSFVPSSPSISQHSSQKKKYSILVVDDNLVNRHLIVRILKKNGHTDLSTASDGQKAVELSKAKHFDLILMDVEMPVLDGREASRLIKQNYSLEEQNPPVIVALTAHAMSGDTEKCLSSGMDDFLTKPIDSKALAGRLDYWLINRCFLT